MISGASSQKCASARLAVSLNSPMSRHAPGCDVTDEPINIKPRSTTPQVWLLVDSTYYRSLFG